MGEKGEAVTDTDVEELAFPEKLADDEMMLPVDMRGVGEEFEDVEQMTAKLGAKGTAEAFVKAADYFDANKKKKLNSTRLTKRELVQTVSLHRRRPRLAEPVC